MTPGVHWTKEQYAEHQRKLRAVRHPDQQDIQAGRPPGKALHPMVKRGTRKLNKTETRFEREILEPRQARCPDFHIFAQALALDFGEGTVYRPDFFCIAGPNAYVIEVKGGHVGKVAWSRAGIERFKRAKLKWGHVFTFELWVWKDKEWRQIE